MRAARPYELSVGGKQIQAFARRAENHEIQRVRYSEGSFSVAEARQLECHCICSLYLYPRPGSQVGLEPTTLRLTTKAAFLGRGISHQRDGNLNTHRVVPPEGLMISGVKLAAPESTGPPLPATTATYCSPWTL
jgi:hypothetical protein